MGLIRASQYLSQFRLDVRYIPGRQHIVPDALSRLQNIKDNELANQPDILMELTESNSIEVDSYHRYNSTIVNMDEAFRN